ncbi:MAG: hypothetical protein KF784_12665 [Fimbriimonadaceae bacterium]|nr:hypothetical protein [Fimbriimonadaceae bacterium]
MNGKQSAASLPAAAVLTLLTLSVFYLLRDFGPESAVRKFHRAVLSRDFAKVQESIRPETNQESLDFLARGVWNFARADGRFQIRSLQRNTNQVTAEVEYSFPDRSLVATTLWLVEKDQTGWKVNVNATERLWRDGMIP